ncbi:MAG: S8 family serine peptidase, partial [Bdellovibrionales bacterium]|nr:S8 family serine peptidase [Bdellovibrionales bacterium]
HIAGIIGAEGRDGTGIVGVSPKVSIMALKYYDPHGSGINNLLNTVKAIRYAVAMGANIINYSGGGLEPSEDERKALAEAEKKGILVVAAAGNERSNSDVHAYYPANYPLTNIISVTAIDKETKVLPSSNFGEYSVDLAAPGNEIYSTLPGGKYGYMTGTSQATAFVTGVAALLMASNKDFRKPHLLKKYLTQTGDVDEHLAGKTRYRRRLNSYRALVIKDADEPVNGVRVQNARNIAQVNDFDAEAKINPSSTGSQLSQISKEIMRTLGDSIAVETQASATGNLQPN